MHTKLTLRLGQTLIEEAKRHARRSGKSLSRMVGDYFLGLKERSHGKKEKHPLTPLVASLKGSLRGRRVDIKDYRRHLEQRYL